jgi:hypothetical protein
LIIDKKPAESISGEKLTEPKAKISGRMVYSTLEFFLILKYENGNNTEEMKGKFLNENLSVMEGILFNEGMSFSEKDGIKFRLTSS